MIYVIKILISRRRWCFHQRPIYIIICAYQLPQLLNDLWLEILFTNIANETKLIVEVKIAKVIESGNTNELLCILTLVKNWGCRQASTTAKKKNINVN